MYVYVFDVVVRRASVSARNSDSLRNMDLKRLSTVGARLRRASTSRIRLAEPLLVALIFCVLFAVHARWIFTHFSSDGYLCDSGWLAYLFEAGGPLLQNP